ncbi:MAG: hypothetical protein CVU18_12900 [Betaproteobacteria bacterium HGW-Betaproteobacteria-12]|nr:MAG: hypothetical protein CVU18_12900 [Betaproteobacteria bacterium HGW-Betaproteobacteria-12]
MFTRYSSVATLAVALCFSGAAQAHGDHTHGHGKAAVVVDGAALTVTLDVPLESYLSFDYPPRNEAQQKTWSDFRARLAEPLRFVEPAAAAQCSPAQPTTVPNLEQLDPQTDIVNLVVEFKFDCASPAALKSLGFTAFREHAGLKQLRVQLQNGAARKTLTVRPRFPAVMF